MPTSFIHPAHLLKQALCEYLSEFVPPGSPEGAYPLFGPDAAEAVPVINEEDVDERLLAKGLDIFIWENAPSEELHEGLGVWKISLAITLSVPGDIQDVEFETMEQALWQYLADEYEGDVSGGGDEPGPLAGRLTAASAALMDRDPENFPRALCVGEVWQLKRTPPELDSPGLRVMIFTLAANAEVMPPGFTPAA